MYSDGPTAYSDRPPPLVEVSHLPPVERIEGLPPHLQPLIDARPEWLVRRIERRTVRSHQASQLAGKRRGARGIYATSGDRRVLKLVDIGPDGRPKLELRCPRCRRRPPIGVEGLIRQAERSLAAGRRVFLI